ncbi:DUF4222 domain-containing protein [Enterobacteriaceae bacterium RIT711]|nr:DUF4222 domain-containing protein [Enterobacteriaceae bacterium RIT711]
MNDLQARMRCLLQRNIANAAPIECAESTKVATRYKDRYGNGLSVINAGEKTIIYRRDGYDRNCEMRRDKFLNEFTEVDV